MVSIAAYRGNNRSADPSNRGASTTSSSSPHR